MFQLKTKTSRFRRTKPRRTPEEIASALSLDSLSVLQNAGLYVEPADHIHLSLERRGLITRKKPEWACTGEGWSRTSLGCQVLRAWKNKRREAGQSTNASVAVTEERISKLSSQQINTLKTMSKVDSDVYPYGMLFPTTLDLGEIDELLQLGYIQELSLETDGIQGARCFRITCHGTFVLSLIK